MPLLSLDLRTEVTSMKSQFGQRFQLIAFFTFGTTFALVHHFIGQHLDGKPAGDDGIRLRGYLIVSDQALVGAGSNALSQIIKYCFAGTIAIAFSQYFWTSIEPFSSHRGGGEVGPYQAIVRVRQDQLVSIDAPLAAGKGNPFLPSSIRVWLYAPRLAFISLLMLTMLSIPIVVPGSIHVISSEFGVLEPCSIPSPVIDQVHVSGIYEGSVTRRSITRRQVQEDRHNVNGTHEHTHTPTVRTKAIVNSVLITGSYLPVTSPCGRCSYNATFRDPPSGATESSTAPCSIPSN
ncbi:hypothetical protein DFP72DRAFT_554941 [Ephemerocybe angulata]|uniref:Uncharacterized protein n=1 Tax=Ephemerocybe angulata TaxID=980116 RepID=A0A8H6M1J5_9AGAR|nr:hypothetical protein DFP72DRAFT_554941 [Tulosesus angulatus]